MQKRVFNLTFAVALLFVAATPLFAQRGSGLTDDQKARRWALENELQSIAIVERKVMMPMRDGIRVQADIYRRCGVRDCADCDPVNTALCDCLNII